MLNTNERAVFVIAPKGAFSLSDERGIMGWLKRRPRIKEPQRAPAPKHTSPLSEKLLKEAKAAIKGEEKKK